MTDNKKRKAGYVDRVQTLSTSRKKPNVSPDTIAVPCSRNRKYTFACKFKHRLTIPNVDTMLDVIVLENDICVLVCKTPLENVNTIKFCNHLNTEGVSGRMKKGALNLKAGSIICSIQTNDDKLIELRTPIGGKLLELNEKLIENPNILHDGYDSTGYLAVIYPDTEIPSLTGYIDCQSLLASCNANNLVKGICFEYQQTGLCIRGDKCRFKHKSIDTTTTDVVSKIS